MLVPKSRVQDTEAGSSRKVNRASCPGPSTAIVSNHTRSNKYRDHQPNSRFLNVKGYQTIEDLIQLVSQHGHLSPLNLSAFWSRIPWILHINKCPQNYNAQQQEHHELKDKLESILALTVEGINNFGPRDVTETVLGMAKVVKHVRSDRSDWILGYHQILFQKLLRRKYFSSSSLHRLQLVCVRDLILGAYPVWLTPMPLLIVPIVPQTNTKSASEVTGQWTV